MCPNMTLQSICCLQECITHEYWCYIDVTFALPIALKHYVSNWERVTTPEAADLSLWCLEGSLVFSEIQRISSPWRLLVERLETWACCFYCYSRHPCVRENFWLWVTLLRRNTHVSGLRWLDHWVAAHNGRSAYRWCRRWWDAFLDTRYSRVLWFGCWLS